MISTFYFVNNTSKWMRINPWGFKILNKNWLVTYVCFRYIFLFKKEYSILVGLERSTILLSMLLTLKTFLMAMIICKIICLIFTFDHLHIFPGYIFIQNNGLQVLKSKNFTIFLKASRKYIKTYLLMYRFIVIKLYRILNIKQNPFKLIAVEW